jgi:nicotinamide mononucleotide adenylyltransferase
MLHIGHMEYLLAGKQRCDYLLIGIANPDVTVTKYTNANPHRSEAISNPLTFYERFQMIRGSMLESGIALDEFDIVPFPINYPELLFNYVPRDAKYYMTIYDEWSFEKKASLESLGCSIEVMWQRTNDEKIASGTEVRNLIIAKEPWEHLVPKFVYQYVTKNHIDERLQAISIKKET